MTILDDCYSKFDAKDGVEAIFLVDLHSMKITDRVFNDQYDKQKILGTIQNLIKFLKRDKFDTVFIEGDDNIFLKSLPNDGLLFVIVTNSNYLLGNAFMALRKI